MHLRVLNFLLVRRLQLPLHNEKVRLEYLYVEFDCLGTYKAIVADEVRSFLLGFAVEAAEGSRDARRSEAVNVGLMFTSLL